MSDDEESGSSLPPNDVNLIRQLLDDFRSAKKSERKHIIRKGVTAIMASKDIDRLQPLAQAKIIAQVKEQVKTWFHNHGRSRKPKDLVKYVRRWNVRQVVGALHQKEVEQLCRDHSQAVPGEKAYLKSYQNVLKRYAESLPGDQQTKYQNMANEWSNRHPPQDVQQKMAELHAAKYAKQFSRVMWQQCGMRLIVLEAHHDTKGELCIASHDFNHELGGEAFADVRPEWQTESIMDEWANYAQSTMGTDVQDEDGGPLPNTKRKKKLLEFDRDDNDVPILEDPSKMIARVMEPVVRQFLSIHYNIFSNGKKTAVDWTALSENQDDMVDPKYLPADFKFRDPSKMKKAHYQALLEHWYGRQQNAKINIAFEFKGYWDSSSESVLGSNDSRRLSRRSQPKPKRANSGVNASKNRPGPPGIRAGDPGFVFNSSSSSDGEDEDSEGEDDEDDHPRGIYSKKSPLDLPFAAKQVRYSGSGVAGLHLHKKRTKQSKSVNQPREPESAKIIPAVVKGTPASKPTSPGSKGDVFPTQVHPLPAASPPPIAKKARRPRYLSQPPNLGPQFERPATRHGGKRKVEAAGLPETKESKTKRVKMDTTRNGGKGET